jgi:hypothetical protein
MHNCYYRLSIGLIYTGVIYTALIEGISVGISSAVENSERSDMEV